ncbi:low molecular weight phosphatase family protein [Agromyces subbeticus]|uniref:arsenate reductase/protein-tyrosine-phosphatase family protein n=1 Tax=Agromyces subbeticus TaxID=293890 RepID=UPI00247FF261|nr:low molecular weight phosphatase family protein [Agromyces subbeticus]
MCTGNVCRSPVAEQLLAARLDAAGFDDVRVSSAGTRALAGSPMTPQAADLSRRYGVDPGDHVARQLTEQLALEADLVLTATRAQRAEVAELVPRAARRTYTLREFARVLHFLASDDALEAPETLGTGAGSRMQRAADAASRSRGLAPPPSDPNDDDILDPYRASHAVYDEAGRLIDDAVDAVVTALAAPSVSGGRGGS